MSSSDEFGRLSAKWHDETGYLSNLRLMVEHPAYLQIIAMGDEAVPLLLSSLEREADHWFVALSEITGEDPAAGEETVEGARQKWLAWGRKRQLLT